MAKTLLWDADILRYRCGFAADSQVKKQLIEEGVSAEDLAARMEELDYTAFALGNVKTVIEDVASRYGRDYKMYLTGSGNFREQLATIRPYKGNRDTTHKPKYYKEIKDYLINVWKAEVVEGREADDALGCEQWSERTKSTIIVTIDKDLDMIPGWHYNWVKGSLYDVSYDDANRFFFWQMLVGDTTDNIPGIDKIGPKTADKLLTEGMSVSEMRSVVQDKYKLQYGDTWEEAYTECAALLWIERKPGIKCPFLFE